MKINKTKKINKLLLYTLLFFILPLGLLSQGADITGDSVINRCQDGVNDAGPGTYTITIENTSGNDLTNIVVIARLQNLTQIIGVDLYGFLYVPGSSVLSGPGGFSCTNNPVISGGYPGGCASAPTPPYLTWNIDASCGALTLAPNETLTVQFQLRTDCTAGSASLNADIVYQELGSSYCNQDGELFILVNPGAVTIKKTQNVIPQVLGSDVTWTLTIENTGFGVIENVEVTDELDTGLTYVSSTQSGNNSGQITTWTSNEYAALASMDPGDILTMDITATVISCDNLNNEANVRFGCNPSPANTCFDTDVDGGTARASVQRIVRTPVLEFTPPDIDFTYCDDTESFSFTITNTGDGIAYDVYTIVDLTGFDVTNVSAGASYNLAQQRFELVDDLEAAPGPGNTYTLSFDLTYTGDFCAGSFPSGDLLWQKLYLDECDQEFYPPVELSSISALADSSGLAVAKTGAPSQIEIGGSITYNITSSYSDAATCAPAGIVTVVDTLPAARNYTITANPDGGNIVGDTITWTYTPPATLNVNYTIQVSSAANCEADCDQYFTNSVQASVTDCCGCNLTANASQTTAIECAEGVTSEKTNNSPTERCDDITYTNTYNFPGGSSVLLTDLEFIEYGELQQEYVPGSLSVIFNGSDITGSVGITDNTPTLGNDGLVLTFSSVSDDAMAGRTLAISYDLTAAEATIAACTSDTFYSWSSLEMNTAGSACLVNGIIHETTEVTINSPDMSVEIDGLGLIYHTCETKTVTLTLTQTSSNSNPRDARLELSGLNYFVVDPASVSGVGVTPLSGNFIPTVVGSGDSYIWEFGDLFTGSGQYAEITFDVQKRCTLGDELLATAHWNDLCTDNQPAPELCSVSDPDSPVLLLSGDLLIEKTPETYYANTNQVQWEIYVTNRGTGTAYNVWVDDLLGDGLSYISAVVDDMTGVLITPGQDHTGAGSPGPPYGDITTISIAAMAAGERRQITFIAQQINCTNLTNDVTSNWGCIGIDCRPDVTDHSDVTLPAPNLINTNVINPPGGVDACSSPSGFVTLRNAGQVTCYNLQVTETLPPNLTYVSGSTRWRLNGGGWNGPNVIYDPNPTTSPLVWSSTEIPGLATSTPGDTIEIEFDLASDCPFTGGDITCATQYENPCTDVFNTDDSTFTMVFNEPDITITKTADKAIVGCGDTVTWTIDVTNNSGYTLPIIWLEDTLGTAYTLGTISSTGDATYTGDIGTVNGRVVTWEITNLPTGTTATVTVTADTDSSPCSADLDNTVLGWYGCGAADGLSTTKPGVDPPDNTLCLSSTSVSTTDAPTREPELAYLSIAMSPASLYSCDQSTQLTVTMENTGPTDAFNMDLVITLPAGLSYNTGTSETGLGTDQGGAISGMAVVGDPAISGGGSILTWYDIGDKGTNIVNTIQRAGLNDTLVLRFTVQSTCYTTADLDFDLYYYDCCDDTQWTTSRTETLDALDPSLTVTKTPVNSQVACAADQTWTITVTNNGTGDAQIVRVEDTPGAWIDVRTGSPGDPIDMGGGVYGWEVNNVLNGGGTAVFTLVGTLNPDAFPNQASCATALRQNNVTAVWACGTIGDAIDNDPTTTTDYDCTDSTPASASVATLRLPNLVVTSITPQVNCTSDGSFSGSISVRVTNNGDGDTGGTTFTVEVTDGKGWTGTGTYSNNILAGGFADVTINTGSWTPDCQPCGAPYSFNATVDPAINNDICECNETDNSTGSATTYTVPSPDLEVDSDTLAISCSTDGQATISGTVTLINNGCNTAITQNVPMRFTLYDNTGCGGTMIDQWTETFSSVNIAAGGGTQPFTITNRSVTSNLVVNSTGCQMSIFVEADYTDTICECDGTDNTYCADNKNINIPDIETTADTLSVSCLSDGQVTVAGTVTLTNNGCGTNLNSNVPMRFTLYDNTGCAGSVLSTWTQTFAGVNIASGGSTQVFAITPQTVISDLVTNSTGCQVSIFVEADYNNSVCESDGTNNTHCADNKAIDIPNLQVSGDTLGISCLDDEQFRVSGNVTMTNAGCGSNMTSNIPVRFTIYDNSGCAGSMVDQWTEILTLANIPAGGGTQAFSITNRDISADLVANSTSCNLSIFIEADYNNSICESDGTDNTRCSDKTASIPDLRVNTVTPSVNCTADGSVSGTVTVNVENIGCSDVLGSIAVVQLTSSCGSITFVNQTVNLTAGSNTDLTFNYTPTPATCTCDFTATIDPGNVICEGTNSNNSVTFSNYTPDIPDLEVTADTLSASCSIDGEVSVTGGITATNNGCGSFTSDIPVRFTLYDNTGCTGNMVSTWTETLTGININGGGGTQVIAISAQSITTDLVSNSTGCQFSIGVEADYNNSVCEFDGTNNTHCANNKNVDIPDLLVQSDTLGVTCSTDGNVQVSGNVTMENDGCGSNMTTDVPVRFTLFDGNNCTGTQLAQWTETYSSMNIPAGGGTQTVTITPQTVATNLVTNSTGCEVSIRMEVDYTSTICESNSANNTYCASNIPVDIPDLEYQSDTLTLTGTDDGQAEVSGTVTVMNNGCGSNMTTDIPVRITLYDNINCTGNMVSQWTDTFSSANIPAGGGTQTFTITTQALTGNYCTSSTGCQVSMRVELDHTAAICESDGTDNETCVDKTVDIPDLVVDAVASSIICNSDGSLTGTVVTVSNTGCGDAVNVVVRLASDCGLTFSDQTVDLPAGAAEDVFFPFTSGITDCNCTFSAEIDPDNAVFECDGTNNAGASVQAMLIPDLEVQADALVITCMDDGVIRISGTITLINNGCGPNFTGTIPMRFTLYDNTANRGNVVDQWIMNFIGVNMPSAGGTQTFTIQPHDITTNYCTNSTNCMVSMLVEADYNNIICEWDGTDNTYSTDKTSDCLDLEATAITATSPCQADGDFGSSLSVTVTNSGGNPITEDFSVRVDDGMGWTSEQRYSSDLGGTLPLAAGASVVLNFDWNREFNTGDCNFTTITAQVDSQNEICQCTTDNDMLSIAHQLSHPNLKPTEITPTCSGDGTYLVKITMENDGCAAVSAGTFTVHLEDDHGNTGDVTVNLENSLPVGDSMTVEFTAWPAECSPNTVMFTATVDYNNDVCEMDGQDNSMTFTFSNGSPDLQFTDVTPSTTCPSPGNVNGKIQMTIINDGNAPLTEDFKIIVNDGEGWSTELFYNADLGGTLPIGVGESVTFPVKWNRDFSKAPLKCDFNNMNIALDVQAGICECGRDNNETVTTYRVPYPDIAVDSLVPVCEGDGTRRMQVTISNDGCDDQRDDFIVNFTDLTGQSRNISFTELGGVLPLKKGKPQTLTLLTMEFDCSNGSMEYTVTLAPGGNLEDLSAENNTLTTTYTANEPDLFVDDMDWTCNGDGTITFTVTVGNQGFGPADNVPFKVYDESGKVVFSDTVTLAQGATTPVTFTTGNYPTDENLTFRFVVDEDDQVCECDGGNNEKSITINCPADGEPQLKIGTSCPPGQSPGGLFRFEIQIENTGNSDLSDVKVFDTLPDGFQYVPGSSAFDGQLLTDPQTGPPLEWLIGTLQQGAKSTLVFSAVADADIDPGRYSNQVQATASQAGGTGIFSTGWMECYTVVVRETGAGCCLDVEEWPLNGGRRPEGPLSFIEPYFHTESAMFTVYSIFNLWNDVTLEKGSMPLFMKERLLNYAGSTLEEFYLASRLGLTLPDGSLWLSFAGAYPEQVKTENPGLHWVRKQVDETMTVSQIGFELPALNEAVKVEKRDDIKQKYKLIIDKKLAFLAQVMDKPEELPHGWEIKEKTGQMAEDEIKKLNAKATLYDKAVLHLAMVELAGSGYADAKTFGQKTLNLLKPIDNSNFDGNNVRAELIFIFSLLESGRTDQAKAKLRSFESIWKKDDGRLDNLHDYALAAAVDYKAGGSLYPDIMKRMKEKFYLKDMGIYADKQPDFTFKMDLPSLASLLLSFDTKSPEEQAENALVLYRTFDEVGLFLKKRNLMVGKPLYSLLKNYPFSEPMLPVLSFTKAKRSIAPVFSQDAIVHSTLVKPLGEILIPQTFSKILSPVYETGTSRIAAVSFGLQYFGKQLMASEERIISEEGRSLVETGKKYVDSLMQSGAGMLSGGSVLLPYDNIAVKGPKQGEHNLEPLNAGTGAQFSTEALADYMVAEKYYVEGAGKHMDEVKTLMAFQARIVEKFKEVGYIPAKFNIFLNKETDGITVIPSGEKASGITAAKLFHLLPKDKAHKFFKSALKKSEGMIAVEDLIFLSAVPELVPYFEKQIEEIVGYKDSKISYNAADIIGRRLLGQSSTADYKKSLENLLAHWDKEAVLPVSDKVETIEKGIIYHHAPQQFLLYLVASEPSMEFRFKRTLNFFTYLLENEWGLEWNSFIKLPSAEYQVFREKPRERFEPGDLVNLRVRVDNTCPDGFGAAKDLSSLFLKADFTPPLVYMGTEKVEGLDVLGDFQWRYYGFPEGKVLEYTYQGFVPYDFNQGYIDGTIYAGGRQGYRDFGPDSASGDDCDDIDTAKRLNIVPFDELQGLVFNDVNANGVKDRNELGVPNILFKDTRGRMYRSDAEGRFGVLAGDEHEGVQIELKSVPGNYLVNGKPTRLVNRHYVGEIYFALIPTKTVKGFVYVDKNGNGAYDEGEVRPAGVLLQTGDEANTKVVITGNGGTFIFRNLPELWQEWIKVTESQPFYKGNKESLKFSL